MKKDIVIPLTTNEVKITLLEKQIESLYQNLRKKLNDHRNKEFITCEERCFCWDIAEFLRKYEEGNQDLVAWNEKHNCLLYIDPEKNCQALKDRKKELAK